MKKICMIFCGGTVTMKRNAAGTLTPFYDAEDVLGFVPQLKKLADISVIKLINVDSSNMDPQIWTKLAHTIAENSKRFDGFVIAHGTDTMAYTASAMSFALSHIRTPIVFTGAQKPAEDVPSDAANNLINATLVATKITGGVSIVFGTKILQGNRATKISESSLEAFDSPMVSPIGQIALEPVIAGSIPKLSKAPLKLHTGFDPRVIVIQVTPGLSRFHLRTLLSSNIRGIVFEAFGPGNLPKSLVPFLHEAHKSEIPIVILSQCRKGITRMQLYEVGQQALDAGVIPGGDMTVEAAATKLMWVLSQTQDIQTIKEMFGKSIAGEVTI